jgi:Caspase domain
LRILVLDSCRDNPLAENLRRSIAKTRGASMPRGLNKMEAPLGTIISFSTQAGETAEDGKGRNSPYTTAFLKHIEAKQEIGDVFREISTDVYDASGRVQLPELSLSIVGKFYLNGPVSATSNPPAASAPADPCTVAEAHWRAADIIGTSAAYEDHVAKFPGCAFANLAKAKMEQLKTRTAVAAPSDASADKTRDFDGKWDIVVRCSDVKGALGFARSLVGTVTKGVLHAEDPNPSRPMLVLDGEIGQTGKAILNAHGVTGDSAFTVGNRKPGSPYSFSVEAQFERTRGSGKRLEVRPCELTFAKR